MKKWNNQLWIGIKANNLALVQDALNKGGNVEAEDEAGYPALHLAAMHGHVEVAQLLLAHGADVNAPDQHQTTPLQWAARFSSDKLVRLLLDAGAELELGADAVGYAALHYSTIHYAAGQGSPETIRLLVERGANINIKDKYGRTPLHLLALFKRGEVVDLLLELGADINSKDEDGLTPLQSAVKEGSPGTLRALLKHNPDLEQKDRYGQSLLDLAFRVPGRDGRRAEVAVMLYEAYGFLPMHRYNGRTLMQRFAGNEAAKAAIRDGQRAYKAKIANEALNAAFSNEPITAPLPQSASSKRRGLAL